MTSAELQTLFENHYGELCNFARKLVPSEEVHDIVMDTFVNVFEHPEAQANHSHVRNYLYLSVRNKCVDNIRRQKFMADNITSKDDETFIHDANIESRTEDRETIADVVSIINMLPPKQKMIIELAFFTGATREEIAQIMGISPNTVRNQKAAAEKSLKTKFNQL